ncbi:MAG: hypothetical protein WB818_12555, partial [Desulfobacterales bacterium]
FKQTINRRLSSSKRILNSKQTIFGCFRKQNNDSNKYKSLRVSLSQKIADAISLSLRSYARCQTMPFVTYKENQGKSTISC